MVECSRRGALLSYLLPATRTTLAIYGAHIFLALRVTVPAARRGTPSRRVVACRCLGLMCLSSSFAAVRFRSVTRAVSELPFPFGDPYWLLLALIPFEFV